MLWKMLIKSIEVVIFIQLIMSPIFSLLVEVLELILSQMPLQEFVLSHSVFCK